MVARKLNRMIAEHPTLLRNKSSGLHRPLLVILDRNTDLITPIQHTSTYQALIDDRSLCAQVLSHMLARPAEKVSIQQTADSKEFDGRKFEEMVMAWRCAPNHSRK